MIETNDRPSATIALGFSTEAGLGLFAIVLGWLLGLERPPLDWLDWSPAAVWQGLLAAVPMMLALVIIARRPFGPFRRLDAVVRQLIVPLFRGSSTVQLILLSLAAGLGEELLFRGAIQPAIQQYSGSLILAVIVANLLFGVSHAITLGYAVVATVIGVYFSWLMVDTGNLAPAIVAHAAYDFFALWYLLRRDAFSARQATLVKPPEANTPGVD